MAAEDPQLVELRRLQEAYRQAIDDVSSMNISEIARASKMLEIEAHFLGTIEACREALQDRQDPVRKAN